MKLTNNKGNTLVEVIVSIVIIGILITILSILYFNYTKITSNYVIYENELIQVENELNLLMNQDSATEGEITIYFDNNYKNQVEGPTDNYITYQLEIDGSRHKITINTYYKAELVENLSFERVIYND